MILQVCLLIIRLYQVYVTHLKNIFSKLIKCLYTVWCEVMTSHEMNMTCFHICNGNIVQLEIMPQLEWSYCIVWGTIDRHAIQTNTGAYRSHFWTFPSNLIYLYQKKSLFFNHYHFLHCKTSGLVDIRFGR